MENDCRLLDGWGEDDTSGHYQTCMLALPRLAEINVHVMKSQENGFVICDACMSWQCAVQFLR